MNDQTSTQWQLLNNIEKDEEIVFRQGPYGSLIIHRVKRLDDKRRVQCSTAVSSTESQLADFDIIGLRLAESANGVRGEVPV